MQARQRRHANERGSRQIGHRYESFKLLRQDGECRVRTRIRTRFDRKARASLSSQHDGEVPLHRFHRSRSRAMRWRRASCSDLPLTTSRSRVSQIPVCVSDSHRSEAQDTSTLASFPAAGSSSRSPLRAPVLSRSLAAGPQAAGGHVGSICSISRCAVDVRARATSADAACAESSAHDQVDHRCTRCCSIGITEHHAV